jgi:phage N-6-adenine-methyltransferase
MVVRQGGAMTSEVHFSSQSKNWQTPKYIFDYFNDMYQFDLDPCASQENALCDKFYTEADNGLTKSWANHTVFMNPPYGQGVIDKWVEKAFREVLDWNATVVCLLPSRTDTDWFWNYCVEGQVYFLNKRIKFIPENGSKIKKRSSAPFPSMIVIFEPIEDRRGVIVLKSNSVRNDVFSLDHQEMLNKWNARHD